jgi:DNA-directed RNA polymerase subunit beta'
MDDYESGPVIPPELVLVPLGWSRFATSDLNDLYRRGIFHPFEKINGIKAPEVILKNENVCCKNL